MNPSVIGAFDNYNRFAILYVCLDDYRCSYLVYRKQRPHHAEVDLQDALDELMLGMCFVFVLVLLTLEDDTAKLLVAAVVYRWGWAGCLLVETGLLNL